MSQHRAVLMKCPGRLGDVVWLWLTLAWIPTCSFVVVSWILVSNVVCGLNGKRDK